MKYILLFLISLFSIIKTQQVLTTDGGLSCTTDNQCNFGTCENSTCKCELKYTGSDCSYAKKFMSTASLLNILWIGGLFGVDRLYLGYTGLGAGKLILGLGFIPSACVFPILLTKGKGGLITVAVLYAVIGGGWLAGLIWSIVDLAAIASGEVIVDGNGFLALPPNIFP